MPPKGPPRAPGIEAFGRRAHGVRQPGVLQPSTITVDFIRTGDDAATVRIEHETGDADRFDDWDGLIKPYAELPGVYTP